VIGRQYIRAPVTTGEVAYLRANYRRRGDIPACARAMGVSEARVRRILTRYRIRPQTVADVLAYLSSEPRTAREVAEVAGWTAWHTRDVLRGWLAEGRVERMPGPGDGRRRPSLWRVRVKEGDR
jgi:hypothetical protein